MVQLQDVTADNPADHTYVPEQTTSISSSTPLATRSKARGDVPSWFANVSLLGDENFAFRCDGEDPASDPIDLNDVTGRSDEAKWRRAKEEEINSLNEN